MCGILGIAYASPAVARFDDSRQAAALSSLAHRGPDACGEWRDEAAWLGHRRLSILDLSEAGNQPMSMRDGRYVLTYNGEVYNYLELMREFGINGLRSHADSEVVLHLFARMGTGCLRRLNGQFAFAVYDRLSRKLWLVRDRMGIKPLYYRFDGRSVAFASEIKALLALAPESAECNVDALHEWLYFGNALGGSTLYRDIRQVLPGHCVEVQLPDLAHESRAYWCLAEQAREPIEDGRARAVATTRELLERAVARQLVSDVPVGVFLSGGVDSSAITAFASRHYSRPLTTYSASFDFDRDEQGRALARSIATRYATEHHEIVVNGADVAGIVESLVASHDMPFADAANIPLQLMAAGAAPHTKVVLQGDGGDELFGGYRRYATLTHLRMLRLLAHAARPLVAAMPVSVTTGRIDRYRKALTEPDAASAVAALLTAENRSTAPTSVFAPQFRLLVEKRDPFANHRKYWTRFGGHDARNRMSLLDLAVTLPDTFLEKVDRSTMSSGLEVRVPFLDHDLVDYVVRLPGSVKMPFGRRKFLLKAALRGIVPDDVLDAPKKGLTVPIRQWLVGPLEPLFSDHLLQFDRDHPGILDVPRIRVLHDLTRLGRQNHSTLLWKVLNFSIWGIRSGIRFNARETIA